MRDLMVPVGIKATFRCEAVSLPDEFPATLPIWKKNGVNLVIDGGFLIFLPFFHCYRVDKLAEFHMLSCECYSYEHYDIPNKSVLGRCLLESLCLSICLSIA